MLGLIALIALSNDLQNLYSQGKIEEALKFLQEHPDTDTSYYYNLGTLHLKLNHTGQALAYLEKAHHLRPHDPDILYNLSEARSQFIKNTSQDLDPSSLWIETLGDLPHFEEIRILANLLGISFLILWLKRSFGKKDLKSSLVHPLGIVMLLNLGMILLLQTASEFAQSHPLALSLQKQIVRSGPGDPYLELAQIEGGIKLRVIDEGQNIQTKELWKQVRYAPKKLGWVRASHLLFY